MVNDRNCYLLYMITFKIFGLWKKLKRNFFQTKIKIIPIIKRILNSMISLLSENQKKNPAV